MNHRAPPQAENRIRNVPSSVSASLLRVKSGEILALVEASFSIGRDPSCALRVNDRHASRVHAEIRHEGDAFVLYDRSSNGTWVNGVRVKERRTLAQGDKIRVGKERFIFTIGQVAEPTEEPQTSPYASTVRVDVVPAPPDPLLRTEPGSVRPFLRHPTEHPARIWVLAGAAVLVGAALLLLVVHWVT